jgi:hypothetical protein
MSQPERQEQLIETLQLLGRLTPADVQTNRDELFFRAGEASARGELAASSFRRFAWPAVAATLALLAAGLGYTVANRKAEIQIVYVERPAADNGRVGSAHRPVGNRPIVEESNPAARVPRSIPARYSLPLGTRSDLIQPQDWAALSDAFAQQLRLQHERSQALANVRNTEAERNDQNGITDTLDKQPRTYLEFRDAMQAM